jgi:hypothetical protein
MKQKVLEMYLRVHGCAFLQHGAEHDVWINLTTDATTVIPMHKELNIYTALDICKQLGVPKPPMR